MTSDETGSFGTVANVIKVSTRRDCTMCSSASCDVSCMKQERDREADRVVSCETDAARERDEAVEIVR